MRQSVLNTFAFDLNYLKMLVGDIPDDQMCDQPSGLENHPAWSIGHLSAGCQFCIRLLGGEPSMPEGWTELFGRGSTPSPDASKYPTKAELLTELERSHQQVTELVAAVDDAKLAEETPDPDFQASRSDLVRRSGFHPHQSYSHPLGTDCHVAASKGTRPRARIDTSIRGGEPSGRPRSLLYEAFGARADALAPTAEWVSLVLTALDGSCLRYILNCFGSAQRDALRESVRRSPMLPKIFAPRSDRESSSCFQTHLFFGGMLRVHRGEVSESPIQSDATDQWGRRRRTGSR